MTLGVTFFWERYHRKKDTVRVDNRETNLSKDMKSDTEEQPPAQRIELSERSKARNRRFENFEKFHKCAREIFEPFKTRGEREKYYDALYMLCVCPGSRMGGRESRIVEFFWGNRLFDKNEGLSQDGHRSIHFESEAGATMFFFKNDDGYVSIQMYPAHTEHRHPIEDFIIWRMAVNPSRLLKKRFQKHCWRAFMAYMEVTSIDGAPTFWQRIQVWCYRTFKHVVVDKKEIPLRYVSFISKIGTWVLTVGFSGLVIFLLQLWLSPNPSEHQNILDIRQSAIQTETMIEYLKNEVSCIKYSQDSLINVMNESMDMVKQKEVFSKQIHNAN